MSCFSLVFDIFQWRLESTLQHHLCYALLSKGIRRSVCQSFPLSLNTPPSSHPVNYFSTANGRSNQIAGYVRYMHSSIKSQCNNNPNPSHTYQHHCQHCYEYDPVRDRLTTTITLFVFVTTQLRQLPTQIHAVLTLAVYRRST